MPVESLNPLFRDKAGNKNYKGLDGKDHCSAAALQLANQGWVFIKAQVGHGRVTVKSNDSLQKKPL